MDEIDLLTGVLDKTGGLIAGVRDDQLAASTPCPDFDVQALLAHILGYAQVFATAAEGGKFEGDPTAYRIGADPAAAFGEQAARMVAGWRAGGLDRQVTMLAGEMPAQMVFGMTMIEYVSHGWDLATAIGRPAPYTDAEAQAALTRAEATLPPQYRGEGQAFGDIVEVPADAPALDRFVGFMGRTP